MTTQQGLSPLELRALQDEAQARIRINSQIAELAPGVGQMLESYGQKADKLKKLWAKYIELDKQYALLEGSPSQAAVVVQQQDIESELAAEVEKVRREFYAWGSAEFRKVGAHLDKLYDNFMAAMAEVESVLGDIHSTAQSLGALGSQLQDIQEDYRDLGSLSFVVRTPWRKRVHGHFGEMKLEHLAKVYEQYEKFGVPGRTEATREFLARRV